MEVGGIHRRPPAAGRVSIRLAPGVGALKLRTAAQVFVFSRT